VSRFAECWLDVGSAVIQYMMAVPSSENRSQFFLDWLDTNGFEVVVWDMDKTMSAKHCGSGLLRVDMQEYVDHASPDFITVMKALSNQREDNRMVRCAVATGSDPLEYSLPGQSKESHILGPDLAKALVSYHCPEAMSLFDIMVGFDYRLHSCDGKEGCLNMKGKRHHMRLIKEHLNVPFEKMVLIDDTPSCLVNEEGWSGVLVKGAAGFLVEHCLDSFL
jgi:hypothetical protein